VNARSWERLADLFLGARPFEDEEQVRVARLLVLVGVLTAVTAGALVALRSLADPVAAVPAAAVVVVTVAGLWLLRVTHRAVAAANVVALAWMVLLTQGVFLRGNVGVDAMVLAVVPHLMTVLLGRRTGFVYLVLCALTIVGLAGYQTLGYLPQSPITPRIWAGVDSAAAVLLSVLLFGVARAQEANRENTLQRATAAEAERVRAETEAQLMRTEQMAAVGQLAAGTAHEINNPLTYVIANLALVESRTEGEVRLAIADALLGARQIQHVVRDMRSYMTRDEEDEVEPAQTVSLAEEVALVAKMLAKTAEPRATVTIDVPDDLHVRASATRLRQVLLNLTLNAAQAIPPGAPDRNRIELRARGEGDDAVLTITDTGSGIPPELMEKIFRPFFTTKPVGVGTGLGLAVCRNLIRRLEGELHLESEVDEGTRVTVILPRAERPVREDERSQIRVRGARVLIIDDDRLVARALGRMLRRHEVEVAEGGRAGLEELAGDQDWDLVLCDLMMPEVDGRRVFEEVTARWPELLPNLVFMTGGAFTEDAQRFQQTVPNRFLDKPLSLEDIQACLPRTTTGRPKRTGV